MAEATEPALARVPKLLRSFLATEIFKPKRDKRRGQNGITEAGFLSLRGEENFPGARKGEDQTQEKLWPLRVFCLNVEN